MAALRNSLCTYSVSDLYKSYLEEYLQQGVENISPEKLSSVIEDKYVVEDLLENFDKIRWW